MGFDEVWVIGDTHFLAKARRSLEEMKENDGFNNNRPIKGSLLYLLQNFEVIFGTCHYSWCFTTQIRGGLSSLLSTRWRLPNYIYVLFSNDQIQESDTLGDEIYKVLEDLFTFINRSLMERKDALPKKARRFKHSQITIVKTVAKSTNQLMANNFKNRRRNFNRALQKSALQLKWRSINIDSLVPTTEEYFEEDGNTLSDKGFRALWKFLSDDLKAINNRESENPIERDHSSLHKLDKQRHHGHKYY